jgi:hypothetical protein
VIDQRRCQSRAFACFKPQILSHGVRDDEYVGKQYRAVKAETADRLECYFSRGVAVIAKLKETALLRAQFAIFGQIAPRLPHQPHRRHVELCPFRTASSFLVGTGFAMEESNNQLIDFKDDER